MRHKPLTDGDGARRWAIILDTDDEVTECIGRFAREQQLHAAHFTAIGACRHAVLGYFEWERREYRRNTFDRQLEVVSLIGDIASKDGEPQVHMHAVLGQENGGALAGHLLEAQVRPTLEIMLTESPTVLHKRFDSEAGLALIHIDEEEQA
jgi:predicted DNA-binding protein with PD1-like motif